MIIFSAVVIIDELVRVTFVMSNNSFPDLHKRINIIVKLKFFFSNKIVSLSTSSR